MDKNKVITDAAIKLGKNKQDLSNWSFKGEVPKNIRFDIYLLTKTNDFALTNDDFENFKK